MTSSFSDKVAKVYTALINRINSIVSTHNSSSSAHSDIRSSIPTKTSDLTNDSDFVNSEELENFEKVKPALEVIVTGTNFSTSSSSPFTSTGTVIIDYGDGTTESYTGQRLNHTYSETGEYTVKIYGSITSIAIGCFNGNSNIKSIVIGNSMVSLGDGCFYNCANLISVDLGSVTSLGQSCFGSCNSLTSIDIPNSVTSLGGGCFNNCTGLTSIIIPNSITNIPDSCFQNCTGLTNITIPDNVTNLGMYCFSGCNGLTSIDLGNSVTILGMFCFEKCTGLTTLTIPKTVTTIQSLCFRGTSNLTLLYLNWDSYVPIEYNTRKWLKETSVSTFSIPIGTTNLYTARSYPLSMLVERTTPDVVEETTTEETTTEETTTEETVTEPVLRSHLHTTDNILNFPTLSTVATSGSYTDLSNKPTIIDNLTSTSATDCLSAKQGKALNDLIGESINYINQ